MPGKFKGKTPKKLVCLVATRAGSNSCVSEADVRLLLGLVGANLSQAQTLMSDHMDIEPLRPSKSEFCLFLDTLNNRLTPDQETLAD